MALSSCFFASPSLKIDRPSLRFKTSSCQSPISQTHKLALKSINTQLFGQQVLGNEKNQCSCWSFVGGSTNINISRPVIGRNMVCTKGSSVVFASWLSSSHIASSAFTLGTISVLPMYTLMVVAPKSDITKKLVGSSIPYVGLGLLYAYLLYLSWTPDTIRYMFASKYWLPELPGIAKMFSSEMTLASAWIHLLAIDLFAARQVYYDGLQDDVETRHSVSLCLLFCPVGILVHFITKAITRSTKRTEHGIH